MPILVKRSHLVSAIENPMVELRRLLEAHPSSSNVIAELSGVPSSVVRSVRNGQTGNMRVESWGRLMVWLLGEGRAKGLPRTIEELKETRGEAA